MKKIYVTGKNGYISKKIVESYSDIKKYDVHSISLRSGVYNIDFNNVDTVIHLAAVVHQRETQRNIASYKKVNCELTYKLAEKAKAEGVKNFIFMSTMAVYGLEGSLEHCEIITKNTKLNPRTEYAKSKLMAENRLKELADENFIVKIIRPPMVYGEGAPGNPKKLLKLATYLPIFPRVKNQRSMIEINTLTNHIRSLVESKYSGLYFPQENSYMSTTDIYVNMRSSKRKKTLTVPISLKFINKIPFKRKALQKIFGNLVYSQTLKFISWECIAENER